MMTGRSIWVLGIFSIGVFTTWQAHAAPPPLDCDDSKRVCTVKFAGPVATAQDLIYKGNVYLTPNQPTVLKTTNLAGTSLVDTVMMIFDPTTKTIICSNDDSPNGGRGSELTAPSSQCNVPRSDMYHVVIHAYEESRYGTCDLMVNNAVHAQGLKFGGRELRRASDGIRIEWSANERFTVVQTSQNGEDPLDTVFVAGSNRGTPTLFDDDGGIDYRSAISTGATSAASGVGYAMVGLYSSGGPVWGSQQGTVRVYRNDVDYVPLQPYVCLFSSNDLDCDGLGNQLEDALGTCKADGIYLLGAVPCGFSPNAKDTDGDGLPDDWEVLGRIWSNSGVWQEDLARHGADPLHKDVFVQIDIETGHHNQHQTPWNTWKTMLERTIDTFNGPGGAHDLANPDGSSGLRLHFDVPSTLYNGNPIAYTDSGGDYLGSYGYWGQSSTYTGSNNTSLSVGRKGSWWHARFQDIPQGELGSYNSSNGIEFEQVGGTLAHELGHAMGLSHGGGHSPTDFNCNILYPSTMNYLFDASQDANAFLNGTSIGFSSGQLSGLIQGQIPEKGVFAHLNASKYDYLQTHTNAQFSVDTTLGNVDWNRQNGYENGAFSIALEGAKNCSAQFGLVTNIYGYQHFRLNDINNYQPLNGQNVTYLRAVHPIEVAPPTQPPTYEIHGDYGSTALANFNGTTYFAMVVYMQLANEPAAIRDEPRLILARLDLTGPNNNIRKLSIISTAVPKTLLRQKLRPEMVSVSVTPQGGTPEDRLYVIFVDTNNKLTSFYLKGAAGSETVSTFQTHSNLNARSLDVTAYKTSASTFALFYKGSSNDAVHTTITNGNWSGSETSALYANDTPSILVTSDTAPSVVDGPDGKRFMFFTHANSNGLREIRVARETATTNIWELLSNTSMFTTSSTPPDSSVRAIYTSSAGRPNHFQLYLQSGSIMLKYVSGVYTSNPSNNAPQFQFQRLHNVEYQGLNQSFAPSLQQNGKALEAVINYIYLPYADSVLPSGTTLNTANDWHQMALNMCEELADRPEGAGIGLCQ